MTQDKFEDVVQRLLKMLPALKDVLVVYLYGSVARGDHSLRHSDLDLFIVLDSPSVSKRIKERIDRQIVPVGLRAGVRVHAEYQGTVIRKQDQTLLRKIVEEGRILYSSGVFTFSYQQLGLRQFIVYNYSSKEAGEKTMLSKILRGRRSSYRRGSERVVKTYKGLVDGISIISLGRGVLMVVKQKQREIEGVFERQGADYRIERIVYAS
jgi:predicted nucleotidyltransferase